MSIRQAIAGAIWTAILAIALQLVPNPVYAHAGHAHHMGDVTAAAHQAGIASFDHKAAPRQAQPRSFNVSAMPDRSEDDFANSAACTGGCCGAGAGCCGAALIGAIAELPEIGAAIRVIARVVDRQSGIDPDGLARPPRILAL